MAQTTKVLGIGNLVRQDEGVGIHLLRLLAGKLPPEIELIDGGTMGFPLLSIIETADRLLILDAVETNRAPGEIAVWHDDQVPYFFASKMSVHQVSFADILTLAKFNDAYPTHIAVVGIQPHILDWGTELSDVVSRVLPQAVERVEEILRQWTMDN
ncbi:MAG: HyaD/HybD family hydrogenase maturation endopeptidase [Peptococcaceae bacterium]|jgi:hydrogenase maturation protease|nr:HyaD/HybD family hydrogenase maturation endopeptidase [Peptococcaceae bacterium]